MKTIIIGILLIISILVLIKVESPLFFKTTTDIETKEDIEPNEKDYIVYTVDIVKEVSWPCSGGKMFRVIFRTPKSSIIQNEHFCTIKSTREFINQIDPFYEF